MALNNLGLGIAINVAGNAARQLSHISSGFRDVTNAARNASRTGQRFGQQFVQAVQSDQVRAGLNATGTAMLGLGIAASGGMAKATSMFGDFQQQMLNIQAVAGMTKDQYKDLTDFAIKMGADTKFSASQVANAMYEIAVSGISATEEIKRMTKGVADFASAGGIDLPKAASTMVSAMKAFQIPAEESTKVADIFSKAMTSSSFRADEFELALSQVGGVANMVGQSLEQTLSGLMALRNAGISASDGATSLKTAMMMLINPTGEAESMINQLGIKIRDAQGNMKSWPEIVGEFEKAFGNIGPVIQKFRNAAGMTREELDKFAEENHLTAGQLDTLIKASFQGEQAFKEVAMATIFGQDGIRAMATALAAQTKVMRDGREVTLTGAEALREWENQLKNSEGTSAKMAETMNSGINFAIEEMMGAMESAAIVMGQHLEPTVRNVTEVIGGLFDWFSSLPEPVQRFVANSLAAVAVGGTLGGIFLLLIGQIPKMIQGAQLAGKAFMWMGGGLKAAGSGAMFALRWLALHTAAIAQNTLAATVNFARWLGGLAVMGAVRGATLAWTAAQWLLNVALNANPIGLIVIGIAALVAAIVWAWNNVDWFRNGLIAAWNYIVAGTQWLMGMFKAAWDAVVAAFWWVVDQAKIFVGNVITTAAGIVDWFQALPGKIMGFLADLPGQALEFGKNFVTMIGDGIASGVDYVKEKVVGVAQKIKDFLGFGSPTKYGPGADSDKWMPNMIGMLANDLERGAPVVGMSAARIAQAARDEIDGLEPTITPTISRPVAAPAPAGAAQPTRPILTQPQPQTITPEAIQTAVEAGQQANARTQTSGGGPVQQIIQLVVDGQVLAQILANIQGENDARSAAY